MNELAGATGHSLSLPDVRQWREMVPDGFETLSFDTCDYDLSFEDPVDVLRHLKLTGVNALGRTGRAFNPLSFRSRYPRMLDGECHLTYRTVRMILRKNED